MQYERRENLNEFALLIIVNKWINNQQVNFVTKSHKGTGLGLYISKNIVITFSFLT